MDSWTDRPPKPPYRCHKTHLDGQEDGPYFTESFAYFEGFLHPDRGDIVPVGAPVNLIHSARWIRDMCSAPGSPFVLLDRAEHERLVAETEALRLQRDDLAAQVDELKAEVRRLREQNPTSPAAIAEALRAEMDERYARKSGRKPAA